MPAAEPGELELAELRGLDLTGGKGTWKIESGPELVHAAVRVTHVATATIEELLCGAACCVAGLGGGGAPADPAGPRVAGEVRVEAAGDRVRGRRAARRAEPRQRHHASPPSSAAGWSDQAPASVHRKRRPPGDPRAFGADLPPGLLRLLLRGTGPKPILGADGIPWEPGPASPLRRQRLRLHDRDSDIAMAQGKTIKKADPLLLAGPKNGITVIPSPTPLTRLHYFDGKFLRARDLELEQNYLRQLVALSNQAGGSGVVHGFDLDLAGNALELGPGLAIDGEGRVLLLPESRSLDVAALLEASRRRYADSLPAPLPFPGGFGCCEAASDEPGTVADGATFYVIAICHAEALCGEEDVYGKLCAPACAGATARPYTLEGVVVRALPLDLGERFAFLAGVAGAADRQTPALALGGRLLRRRTPPGRQPDLGRRSQKRPVVPRRGRRRRRLRAAGPDRESRQPHPFPRQLDGPPRAHRSAAPPLLGRGDGDAAVGRLPRPGAPVPVPAGLLHRQTGAARARRSLQRGAGAAAPDRRAAGDPDPRRFAAGRPRRCSAAKAKASTTSGSKRSAAGWPRRRHRRHGRAARAAAAPLRHRRAAERRLPAHRRSQSQLTVNQQVFAMMGESVDLRFCVVRPDFVPHAFEEAQHMERISLLRGYDHPKDKPRVDILVPDGELEERQGNLAGQGYVLELSLLRDLVEAFQELAEEGLGGNPFAAKARATNMIQPDITLRGAARGEKTAGGGLAFRYAGRTPAGVTFTPVLAEAAIPAAGARTKAPAAATTGMPGTVTLRTASFWLDCELDRDPFELDDNERTSLRVELVLDELSDNARATLRLQLVGELAVAGRTEAGGTLGLGVRLNGNLLVRHRTDQESEQTTVVPLKEKLLLTRRNGAGFGARNTVLWQLSRIFSNDPVAFRATAAGRRPARPCWRAKR